MKNKLVKGLSLLVTASMLATSVSLPAWAGETDAYESEAGQAETGAEAEENEATADANDGSTAETGSAEETAEAAARASAEEAGAAVNGSAGETGGAAETASADETGAVAETEAAGDAAATGSATEAEFAELSAADEADGAAADASADEAEDSDGNEETAAAISDEEKSEEEQAVLAEDCTDTYLYAKDASIAADGTLTFTAYCTMDSFEESVSVPKGSYTVNCTYVVVDPITLSDGRECQVVSNSLLCSDVDGCEPNTDLHAGLTLKDRSLDQNGNLSFTVYCWVCGTGTSWDLDYVPAFQETVTIPAGEYEAAYFAARCGSAAYIELENATVTLSNGQSYTPSNYYNPCIVNVPGSVADSSNHEYLVAKDISVDASGNMHFTAACSCGKVQYKDVTITPEVYKTFTWLSGGEMNFNATEAVSINGHTYYVIFSTGYVSDDTSLSTILDLSLTGLWTPGKNHGTPASITVANAVYTGKAITPTVTVKDANGNKIAAKYYDLTCTSNKAVGTARVVINFKGDYRGQVVKTFKILPKATTIASVASTAKGLKVTWNKVTGATGYRVYRGSKLIYTAKKNTTVSYVDTAAKTNGTKYTYKVVAIASGTGKAAASAAKAAYYMTAPTVKSVTNSASKTMTVKWSKNSKATGYQVRYVLGSTVKKVTVKKAATVKKVIKSLKKGKTYKVSVRAYKTVSGTKYFSAWSAAKSVKIKK